MRIEETDIQSIIDRLRCDSCSPKILAITRKQAADALEDMADDSRYTEQEGVITNLKTELAEAKAKMEATEKRIADLEKYGTLVCQDMENDRLKTELAEERRKPVPLMDDYLLMKAKYEAAREVAIGYYDDLDVKMTNEFGGERLPSQEIAETVDAEIAAKLSEKHGSAGQEERKP